MYEVLFLRYASISLTRISKSSVLWIHKRPFLPLLQTPRPRSGARRTDWWHVRNIGSQKKEFVDKDTMQSDKLTFSKSLINKSYIVYTPQVPQTTCFRPLLEATKKIFMSSFAHPLRHSQR